MNKKLIEQELLKEMKEINEKANKMEIEMLEKNIKELENKPKLLSFLDWLLCEDPFITKRIKEDKQRLNKLLLKIRGF